MSGTQPFLGLIPDKKLDAYRMFWQVDGGGYVPMADSDANYPHKEALVDLSGWSWNDKGEYRVSFIAQDLDGREIARKAMTIHTDNPAMKTFQTKKELLVSSPADGARISGSSVFAASLASSDPSSYDMYWSVDGGRENKMDDSPSGDSRKESLIDFSGWTWRGEGPYAISFTAKDSSGNAVAESSVSIYVHQATSPDATKLYVDPSSPAAAQAEAWKDSRPADASVMKKLAAEPSGIWLGGWNADVTGDVRKAATEAAAQGAVPVFVAYDIPNRDCGSYSAGGESSKSSYLSWIGRVSEGIGDREAIVILEPDALASADCLSTQARDDRYSMLSSAIDAFKAKNPRASVYLDAGHAGWIDAAQMAQRLVRAGISKAAGFSLNVSNFGSTDDNAAYGKAVSAATGGAHFVIDTSRNGNGGDGEWCNPSGRSLGIAPSLSTGDALIDAYLWVKRPGESDGTCNGGPSAGAWWPEYALDLAKRAGY